MEFNIVNDQELISFAGGVSVLAICQHLVRYVAFVIQSVNVQSCGQEVVWSVAFIVSVGQCLGRVLAFVQRWCIPQRLQQSCGRGSPGLTLSSGILGQFMHCRPMCLQRVHYSVSVAFLGSVFVVKRFSVFPPYPPK